MSVKKDLTDAMHFYYTKGKNEVLFEGVSSTLSDSEAVSTGFIDGEGYGGYQLTIIADQLGLSLEQTYKMTETGEETVVTFPISSILTNSQNLTIAAPFLQKYLKFRVINQTGGDVTGLKFELKALASYEGATRSPLNSDPVAQSQALLTKSVIIGQSPNGGYTNAVVNAGGALLTSDFKIEVARGLIDNWGYGVKFGRTPDVDTGTTPEDIYNGGGEYTGFNATANEEISATSDDANDTGALVSSGTATGGSNTTLIDTGATFITDGVAAGDLLINDTQAIHGVITSVDSETQVTVFEMIDGVGVDVVNVSGDAYRIATANNTGAAVLKLSQVLDANYVQQKDVYLILNGTTTVTSSGVTAMRCSRGRVIIAGSSQRNEGEITVSQAVTTANVFCVIPAFGATTIGAFTVPAGKDCIVTSMSPQIVRASGAAGSATIALNVRRFGQAFVSERTYEISTSGSVDDITVNGPYPQGTDIKATVESVSDNNTVAEVKIEYFLVDKL